MTSSRPGARAMYVASVEKTASRGSDRSTARRASAKKTRAIVDAHLRQALQRIDMATAGSTASATPSQRRSSAGSTRARSCCIRVSNPRHVRLQIERRVERIRHPRAATITPSSSAMSIVQMIVRMTAQRSGQARAGRGSAHQRPNVGDETIVPGHQLVELPTCRQILILETRRFAWRRLGRAARRRSRRRSRRGHRGHRERSERRSRIRARGVARDGCKRERLPLAGEAG